LATTIFLTVALPVWIMADVGKGRDELIRTELYAADYHAEARRALKTVNKSIDKVRALLEQAKKLDLVVLEDALEKNIRSLEGLAEVGEEIYGKMADAVPLLEIPPKEGEKAAGDEFLRQINVVKDRATALYVSSRSFSMKLQRDTGSTVTRLDRQP